MELYMGLILPSAFIYNTQGLIKCTGALLTIQQYQALYAIIGAAYGGDGRVNFGIPNLQGRFPMGMGVSPNNGLTYLAGQTGTPLPTGAVQLTNANLPANMQVTGTATTKINVVSAPTVATVANPAGNVLATGSTGGASPAPVKSYVPASGQTLSQMDPTAATTTLTVNGIGGSSAPINVIPPYQVINYFIVSVGLFPTRD